MRYLSFDIECANCFEGTGKICEFGYVITDEKFNILDRKIYLINPNDQFDWYVTKKLLSYKKSEYLASPDYRIVYNQIRRLFNEKDIFIIGHTINKDAKYLNDESKRYNLPFLNYKFFDVKQIYKYFIGRSGKAFGVSDMCKDLDIELPEHEHKSDDDAYAALMILKEICSRTELSVKDIIDKCEKCKGETNEGVVTTFIEESKRIEREKLAELHGTTVDNIITKDKKEGLANFIKTAKPIGQIIHNDFTGKKVCISTNYEKWHYREILSVIQLLANCGGCYTQIVNDCDYFIDYEQKDEEGKFMVCSRKEKYDELVKDGKNIRLLSFNSFLELLGIDIESLGKMDMVNSDLCVKTQVHKKSQKKKENNYTEKVNNPILKEKLMALKIKQ